VEENKEIEQIKTLQNIKTQIEAVEKT